MKTINRRVNPRVEIKLRCHVTSPVFWLGCPMRTENINRGGLLIAWRDEDDEYGSMPRLGQILTVEVELPAHHCFGQKCMRCQGTVVRVNHPETERALVALNLSYIDFRSFQNRCHPLDVREPALNLWTA
jgi:hypothetical protein